MSTTWKWVIGIGIGVLVIGGIVWYMKSNKKAKIKDAAIKTGAPESVAEQIANSEEPALAARQAGFSGPIAEAIASGFSVAILSPNFAGAKKPTSDPGKGNQWCCASYNSAGVCIDWESRPLGDPCGQMNLS